MRRGVLICVLAVFLLPATAHAAFPGQNGKLAFVSERDAPGNLDLYTVNPDGSGLSRLTTHTAIDRSPRWSPDGQRIIFQRTFSPGNHTWYLINADGSGETPITLPPNTIHAAWSPDGTKIVYARVGSAGGLWVSNPDGSSPVHLGDYTSNCVDTRQAYDHQSWSPDGGKITFRICLFDGGHIATINSDGTGFQNLTADATSFVTHAHPDWAPDAGRITWEAELQVGVMNRDGAGKTVFGRGFSPVWSPDGRKIVFGTDGGIALMNPNGTGQTPVVSDSTLDYPPQLDWQPIPVNAYPRPKGASPLRVSLVTAYDQCAAPNRTHGPPLAFGSCNPPAKTSAHLTVGTGDSNGKPARNEGYVRLSTIIGNPGTPADEADVAIDFFTDDVFTNALADYTGELRAELPLRITDKDNTPHPGGPGAATTQDFTFDIDATCVAVANPKEGSSCQTTTTLDALMPGAIKEGRRSIWQLGQVVVYDGGPDGDTATADNTVFARQGIFIP